MIEVGREILLLLLLAADSEASYTNETKMNASTGILALILDLVWSRAMPNSGDEGIRLFSPHQPLQVNGQSYWLDPMFHEKKTGKVRCLFPINNQTWEANFLIEIYLSPWKRFQSLVFDCFDYQDCCGLECCGQAPLNIWLVVFGACLLVFLIVRGTWLVYVECYGEKNWLFHHVREAPTLQTVKAPICPSRNSSIRVRPRPSNRVSPMASTDLDAVEEERDNPFTTHRRSLKPGSVPKILILSPETPPL